MPKTNKNATRGTVEACRGIPQPYCKVEFVHPRSGKRELVEFYADGKLQGYEWVEREYKPADNWKYFVAGMLWTGAIWAILWAVLKGNL